jgi:microcin C transport system permease protein
MTGYFLRRLLLMIPTFVGITLVVFVIIHFVPGGPIERYVSQILGGDSAGDTTGGFGVEIPPEAFEQMRQYYGLDKPVHVRYAQWFWNVLHLDLGRSWIYQEPVWDVIKSRFPVSIFLGVTGFLLSYLICVPLGVLKAVKHGSKFDFASSVIVFVGYCIPGWALGTGLLVLFGGGSFWDIFPLGGFRPDRIRWESLGFFQKIVSQLHYMVLPVFCYMIGEFARLTILTKNAMLETLGQDYIRTAFAKGLTGKRVIFGHALRNSLVPIATGLGHQISLFLAGSFLIEKAFNIPGMGLLGYDALLKRDYPIALGILVISSLLMLVGNLLSDFFTAAVDPRIRFQ